MNSISAPGSSDLAAWTQYVDEVSWSPPDNMTFDEWSEAGLTLQTLNRSVNWWLGDWINHGESAYGEKYAQAIEYTDTSVENLKKFSAVAVRCPREIRRAELSWTHHFYVAYLPEEQRGPTLELAERFSLATRTVKSLSALSNDDRDMLIGLATEHPDMDDTTFMRLFQQIKAGVFTEYVPEDMEDLPFTEPFEEDEWTDDGFGDVLSMDVVEPVEEYWILHGMPLEFADKSTAQWEGITVRAVVNMSGVASLEWEINDETEA